MGRVVGLFLLAALAEIGGVYLFWLWLHNHKPLFLGLLGLVALAVYAVLQTFQELNFGRAFAAYGGVFIVTATLWGWFVDGKTPDRWDWLGVSICLIGVAVMLWAPRK